MHTDDEWEELEALENIYRVVAYSLVNNKEVIFDCLTGHEVIDIEENHSRIYRVRDIVML